MGTTAPSRAPVADQVFHPVGHRSTSCVVIRSRDTDQYSLVMSLSTRDDTQLVRIEPHGNLLFKPNSKAHVFENEAAALEYLNEQDPFEVVERGCALLGFAALGNVGMLLLATRARAAALLPGGHAVRLVTESRWIQVPLQDFGNNWRLTPEEQERVEMMPKYMLNGAHYYCETADVTRPFPSRYPVQQPSWEFVWNRWFSASLRDAGLGDHCPHLLQGVVEMRTLEDNAGCPYTFVLFSRRSCLHPGMRYHARGLNALASPGNEIECEQLVWINPREEGGPLRWSDHTWRRGTVPIWWGVEIKSGGVGEATIVVSPDKPYRGTRRYFRRLQRRYAPDPDIDAAVRSGPVTAPAADGESQEEGREEVEKRETTADEPHAPVICVNLLRCNMQRKDELLLSENFADGLRWVRRAGPTCGTLRILNFDWHGMIKDLKDKGTVEGLWSLLQNVLPESGIAEGTLEPRPGLLGDEEAARRQAWTPWGLGWGVHWRNQQHGVMRYNCADSLDRTNAASYFAAVQVLAEQCRRLGIRVESAAVAGGDAAAAKRKMKDQGSLEISSIHRRVRDMMRSRAVTGPGGEAPPYTSDPSLPPGWEARQDPTSGKTFYIDHNTKATTWVRPPPLESSPPKTSSGAGGHANGVTSSARAPELKTGSLEETSLASTQPEREPSPEKPNEATGSAASQWGLFGLSVDEVRATLRADLVAQHAEVFLINGDMNSNLYTSSRAMHSAILGLLQGDAGGMGMAGVGKLQNMTVSVQRRWANVLSDASRQQVMEMFLGLRLAQHFPSARVTGHSQLKDDDLGSEDGEGDEPDLLPLQSDVSPALLNQATLSELTGGGRPDAAPGDPFDGLSASSFGVQDDAALQGHLVATEFPSSNVAIQHAGSARRGQSWEDLTAGVPAHEGTGLGRGDEGNLFDFADPLGALSPGVAPTGQPNGAGARGESLI